MLSSRAPNSEVCPSQRASFPSRMSLISATARQTTNACEAPTQPSTRSTGASAMRRALSAFGRFTRLTMAFNSSDLSLEPEGDHHEPHRRVHDQGGGRADHRDCAAHGLVVAKEPAAAEAEAAIERQTREAAKEVELDDGDVDRAAEDDGSREPDSLRDRHQEAFPDRPHVSAAPAAPVGGRGP